MNTFYFNSVITTVLTVQTTDDRKIFVSNTTFKWSQFDF